MKILNLYAGIGGNRRYWGNEHEITAVEFDKNIAAIYKDFYPNDICIVADAHDYLLNHYSEFDFIWTSPPCPSHSRMRLFSVNIGQTQPVYPDMKLYEEILFLKQYYKGLYCVENVISWYKPLIEPQKLGRHFYWTNFIISNKKVINMQDFIRGDSGNLNDRQKHHNIDLSKYHNIDKKKILNNMVNSSDALWILNSAIKQRQKQLI